MKHTGEDFLVRFKVMVVGDDADNQAVAQKALQDEGYDVLMAASGQEGVCKFEGEQPDCVLLDLRLPGTDDFVRSLNVLPGGAETPVIFLRGLDDTDAFDRVRPGVDDFLTKPVRPAELLVRVHAALRLRRISAELREHYDLVARQRDDLMRLQLQKARLSEFVVHDLKNPINSMDLHAQVVLQAPGLHPSAGESARHIRDEARSLLRLVLNLLDISKSEEGGLAPKQREVDLALLTAEAVDALELKARMGGVTLRCTLDAPTLRADSDLLRRVIENLLDNAIRHAPAGTEVQVTTAHQRSLVEVRVADHGPGIPPEMRTTIFERFFQGVQGESAEPNATRTGRGLGLAFCKLAVEAQGGTIWVEDGNPGAVFCISLPNGR